MKEQAQQGMSAPTYAYAYNNPLGYVDVGGLQGTCAGGRCNTLPDGANAHGALERITPLWGGWRHDDTLGPIETSSLEFQYVMRVDDHPIGRVHASFQPVRNRTDASTAIRLEITARGKPKDTSLESAFRLLDAERREVVRTFKKVTSPEMHAFWGNADER